MGPPGCQLSCNEYMCSRWETRFPHNCYLLEFCNLKLILWGKFTPAFDKPKAVEWHKVNSSMVYCHECWAMGRLATRVHTRWIIPCRVRDAHADDLHAQIQLCSAGPVTCHILDLVFYLFFQYRSTTLESVIQEFDLREHDLGEYGLGSSTSEWRSEQFWVYSGSGPRDMKSLSGLGAVAWHQEACDIEVVLEWLLGLGEAIRNGTLWALNVVKRGANIADLHRINRI